MSERDGNFDADGVPVESIYTNVSQVVITTTEDKLKNVLNEYDYQHDSKSWIAVLGIFLTLVGTLITSTPNDFLLSQESWRYVYVAGIGAAFFRLLFSAPKAWRAWRNPVSVADIVERIKNDP